MAQDIELQGAQYSDVPAVELPKVGGGTASFTDVTDTTATAADVMSGSYFYTAAGARSAGTLNFPVTSVNGMTGAVKVISDAAPDATSTAAQCLAYAQAHPNVMFTWAKWSAATYTPVQTNASWVYTLYTTYTDASQYTVFEAQNNTNGNLYRCKADGTWERLAAASEIPDPNAWSFEPNNTSTLTSQIDSAITANGVYSFYILSYGHQTATGMPTNANFYGQIFRGSATYITVVAYAVGTKQIWLLNKQAGTWGSWSQNN